MQGLHTAVVNCPASWIQEAMELIRLRLIQSGKNGSLRDMGQRLTISREAGYTVSHDRVDVIRRATRDMDGVYPLDCVLFAILYHRSGVPYRGEWFGDEEIYEQFRFYLSRFHAIEKADQGPGTVASGNTPSRKR